MTSTPPKASLADVIITAELSRRPARKPNFQAESEAMSALLREMRTSPDGIFEPLLQTALKLCNAATAAISLLDQNAPEPVFRWPAIVGRMAHYIGGTMPKNNSPCGVVLDRRAPQLFADLTRYYTFVNVDSPLIEVLLIPFFIDDQPVGTIWIVASDHERKFDAEDVRILSNLAEFASTVLKLRNLSASDEANRIGSKVRQANLDRLQALNMSLEARMAVSAAVAQQRAIQLQALTSEMAGVKSEERRRLAKLLHDDLQQMLVAARMQLAQISDPTTVPGHEAIQRLERIITQAIESSRTLTTELAAPVVDVNLRAGFNRLAHEYSTQHNFEVVVHADEKVYVQEAAVRTFVIEMVRELLFNALKHSGVMNAEVTVTVSGTRLEAVVTDNGRGFEQAAAKDGFGLSGIRHRLALVGGELTFTTSPGHGTSAMIVLPIVMSK